MPICGSDDPATFALIAFAATPELSLPPITRTWNTSLFFTFSIIQTVRSPLAGLFLRGLERLSSFKFHHLKYIKVVRNTGGLLHTVSHDELLPFPSGDQSMLQCWR